MKLLFLILLSCVSYGQIGASMIHCGFDFTSYLVVHPHEDGKTETINGLRISICDESGNEVINTNNSLSWINGNKPLVFIRNYKIDSNKKMVSNDTPDSKWFYYFAKDHYLCSVSNTFKADDYFIKIEDIDGDENGAYKTQIIQLAAYNMYILCTADQRGKVMQFGRRMNRPIEVVMEKL